MIMMLRDKYGDLECKLSMFEFAECRWSEGAPGSPFLTINRTERRHEIIPSHVTTYVSPMIHIIFHDFVILPRPSLLRLQVYNRDTNVTLKCGAIVRV